MGERVNQASGEGGKLKVGVLTFHRCINYGSYWQARCLVESLRSLGHEAVLLDHRDQQIDFAEWRCALQPTLPVRVGRSDREQYGCKARKFLAEISNLPLSGPFSIEAPDQMPEMDAVVVGSDEVWNLRHAWYREKPAFFGDGLRAEKVISYAASFGNYSCWEGLGSPWTDFLRRFSAISVRDENTWWMLKNNLGVETELVLDPCLQFPLSPDGSWQGPQRPFALVYGHSFAPDFAAKVRDWADRRGLPLLSLGYRNDWADMQWLTADPHDYAHAFSRAEAVATNFFHGCVFALANEKPFAAGLTEYRSIKVRGLMELLDAERHVVASEGGVDELLDEPIEPRILSRIEELRQTSTAFLVRALEGSHAAHAA